MNAMTPISTSRYMVEYRLANGDLTKRFFATEVEAHEFAFTTGRSSTYRQKGWNKPVVRKQW